ncbi:MAG: hypothetical protein KJ072_11155 [Verrucomicrobia bacterium]|nr:hypothetical protein [Verrucomicrobiota bacterium]
MQRPPFDRDLRAVAVIIVWLGLVTGLVASAIALNALVHALFPSLSAYPEHPSVEYAQACELPPLELFDVSTNTESADSDLPSSLGAPPAEPSAEVKEQAAANERKRQYATARFLVRHRAIDTMVTSLCFAVVAVIAAVGAGGYILAMIPVHPEPRGPNGAT